MPTTTTAALLPAAGAPFELAELELDGPRSGEVLVELVAVGICHTDLSVAAGGLELSFPVVLGHEGAGTVLEVGEGVSGLAAGDAVVLSYAHCDGCRSCRAGHPAYCESAPALNFYCRRGDGSMALRTPAGEPVGSHFFGQSSFARHAVVHASCAVRVDASASELALLGPLGCSVQTGAGTVLGSLDPGAGERLVIFGAGAVGLSALIAAPVAGIEAVYVVEPDPGRRALALELGAVEAIDPDAGDPARALRKLTGGGAELTIDTVGSAAVLIAALDSLRSPGRCVTLALPGGPNPVEIDQRQLLFGRRLEGVIEGDTIPSQFIPRLLELWRQGRLPFERMIRAYPFEQIAHACEDARSGAAIKPVLSFDAPEAQTCP